MIPTRAAERPLLITFSQHAWDATHRGPAQRSQHVLARLARHWRVLFVEPPQAADVPSRLVLRHEEPGLTLLSPQLQTAGWAPAQISMTRALLESFAANRTLGEAVLWLDSAALLPLLDAFCARCVVFDCSADAAAAPPATADGVDAGDAGDAADARAVADADALARADLVLTASPSQCAALQAQHKNVVCIPPAVDARAFEPSRLDARSPQALAAWDLQASIARPRLGCYGVVDARTDLELLAALADANAEWQIVLAGALRVHAAALPRRANLHWLGPQPSARLPHLLAGWDLCLLPLRADAAAHFTSPCEALEYLAAEKPVVGSAIDDAARLYGGELVVAGTAPAFIAACERLLAETPLERVKRGARRTRMVAAHSWDRSANQVRQVIEQTAAAAGARQASRHARA